MLIAAAVCPCPPLLVPEVAAGAAPETDDLRAACFDALAVVAASRPDVLLVLGPAAQPQRGPFPEGSTGGFQGYGVDLTVRLGRGAAGAEGDAGAGAEAGAGARTLPSSLAVGAWLLERTGWSACPVEGLGVGDPLETGRCVERGGKLAGRADRVAVLALGDGSACRTLKAPGYFDPRAEEFDARAARALGSADVRGLLALEPEAAMDLQASGRSVWQMLAGAAQESPQSPREGRLLYEDAPYGVGYTVAVWS